VSRGTETVASFAAAIRSVLHQTPDRDDMRAVARKAMEHLSEQAVMEAAVTYLAGLARQEHNRQVREQKANGQGPSAEVVNVKGHDLLLGETTEEDRQFLVARGEALAEGLHRRAEQIRSMGATGPSLEAIEWETVEATPITSRKVVDAERRAAATEAMAASLAALLEGRGTPEGSALDQQLAREMDRMNADLARERERAARYETLARNLLDSDYQQEDVENPNARALFAKTRRAIRKMADAFDMSEAS
jgi:hypothetical protein